MLSRASSPRHFLLDAIVALLALAVSFAFAIAFAV